MGKSSFCTGGFFKKKANYSLVSTKIGAFSRTADLFNQKH